MAATSSTASAGQVTIREVEPGDAEACAQILFDAFGDIHDHHRFRRDFPALEAAAGMMGMWIPHPQVWGVVGEIDGRVVGSNFLDERDPIRGVGPITVDPAGQNAGVGRRLMSAVLERGRDARGIRLVQDGFHMRSLSLYTSLGFEVTTSCVLMEGQPRGAARRPHRGLRLDAHVLADGVRRGGVRGGHARAAPRLGGGARPAGHAPRAAPVGTVPLVPGAGASRDQADERDGARRVSRAAGVVVPVGDLLRRRRERRPAE
jgi:GNAT superfamily N-acetyltransferase